MKVLLFGIINMKEYADIVMSCYQTDDENDPFICKQN